MLDISLLKKEIVGKTFISSLFYFDEINSTNEFAKTFPPGENVLIVSEYQSSGKGVRGKKWESAKGQNLIFTIKANFDIDNRHSQSVNFFFSYYLLTAIDTYLRENCLGISRIPEIEIKWPNDLLLEKRKIAGLLVEMDSSDGFIIGIGLNVNQNIFSTDYDLTATSLRKSTGKKTDRNLLLIKIIREFDNNIHLLATKQYEKIHQLWLTRCKMIGTRIVFSNYAGCVENARFENVLENGGILLKIGEKQEIFYSGEISIDFGQKSPEHLRNIEK